jgi:RHS repeat-associated protein
LTKVADASGLETTFTPEPVTRSLTAGTQDNRGLSSTSRFDLRFQAQLDSTDANGQVLTRAYDQYGRLTRVRSPYEAAADLDSIAITYPPSLHSNLPAYASTRNVSVDPSSGELVAMLSTAQFADGHGRILQTQVQAEVDGVVVRIVSPPRSYDYAGRIVCEGHPTFVANLDFGLEAGGCGAQTPYTHTIYDALDRVVQVTTQGDDDITGELVTRHAYAIGVYPGDASRPVRQMTVTDPEGKISRLYYDAAERLVAMGRQLDTRELVTRYEHSAVADLLKVIDARNTQRAFEYDLAGRTVAVTTPNTGRSEYAYDVMGNLIQQTDSELCNATPPLLTNPACANKIVKRQYVRNRLSLIDFPAAADVTLVYGDDDPGNRCAGLGNTRGRLCWTQDEAGTERTSYGALGEKLLSERTIDVAGDPAGARTYATSFLRDSFGRLLRVIYPDGEVVTYGYDAGARLNSAVGERNNVRIGYVMDRRYDVYGKALATDYGNGVTETNEYFANTQRLHRRLVHSGSLLLSGLELRLDRIGNVRRSATERADGHEIADVVRAYSYDDLHRLDTFTLAADGDSAGLEISGDYDYDDAGNITRQRLTHSGDGESFTRDWAYTYNLPAPDLPDAAGPAGFTYDGRGATKTYTAPPEAWTYHWNEGGQLAGVDAGSQSRYLYDSRNTRIWRSVVSTTASGETVTQTTHYPGPFYIASWKRVRPAGCTTGSCEAEIAERTKHVRADARNVASTIGVVDPGAGPVEQSIAYLWSAQHYIHADQVNSTFAMTDSTGLGQEVFEYLPYGEVVSGDLESLKHLSGFDGMELDLDSGLHFFGGRYYRAALGRWLSADPLSLAIQEKQDERLPADSLYAFAMDNPVSLHDPDGLAPGPTADIAMNYMRTNTGLYWFPMRKGKFHTRPGEQKYFESLPTHRFSNFGGEGMKKARGTTNCSTAILEALWQTFAGREEALGLQTKGFSKRFQGKQWVEALEDAKMGYRIDPNDVEPGDIASTEGHRFFIAEVIGDQARVLEANVVKGKGWKTTPAVSEWRLIPLSIIKAAARLIDFD